MILDGELVQRPPNDALPAIARQVARAALIVAVLAMVADGQVVSYECETLPEDAGWSIVAFFCSPEVSVVNGRFVQVVESGQCGPPPNGDQESLSRSIAEFNGAPTFFVEWRVRTTGNRSEIPGTAPALLVAGSLGAVNYHFTIARDQVRFIRDNQLPILYFDVEPDYFRTFRLEHIAETEYRFFIDGQLVDHGIPEGAYPSSSPAINFRAKSWYLDSTTEWDYIRYGVIPQDASGDFDSTGVVDGEDVYFFLDCLLGPDAPGPGCRWADMNGDGVANGDDAQQFAEALVGA